MFLVQFSTIWQHKVGTEQRDSPTRPYPHELLQPASFLLSLKEVCRDCTVKDFENVLFAR